MLLTSVVHSFSAHCRFLNTYFLQCALCKATGYILIFLKFNFKQADWNMNVVGKILMDFLIYTVNYLQYLEVLFIDTLFRPINRNNFFISVNLNIIFTSSQIK